MNLTKIKKKATRAIPLPPKTGSLHRIRRKKIALLSHFSPFILMILFLLLIFAKSNHTTIATNNNDDHKQQQQLLEQSVSNFNRNLSNFSVENEEFSSTLTRDDNDEIISTSTVATTTAWFRHHNHRHRSNNATTSSKKHFRNENQRTTSYAQQNQSTSANPEWFRNYRKDATSETESIESTDQPVTTSGMAQSAKHSTIRARSNYVLFDTAEAATTVSAAINRFPANQRMLNGKMEQLRLLNSEKLKCDQRNDSSTNGLQDEPRSDFMATTVRTSVNLVLNKCPKIWDGALCWPESLADTLATQPCPDYVNGFDPNATAYKSCTKNGTWYVNKETGKPWTDYRECPLMANDGEAGNYGANDHGRFIDSKLNKIRPHIRNFRIISRIGYSLSFVTLTVAFFILIYVKRLRCPRNDLHLQLFASFIIRSSMYFAKTLLDSQLATTTTATIRNEDSENLSSASDTFNAILMTGETEKIETIQTIDPNHPLTEDSLHFGLTGQSLMPFPNFYDGQIQHEVSSNYWDALSLHSSTLDCKIFTTLWLYSLLANYNWILMEGLYLHNIIFMKIFNDNSKILSYIIMGWAIPIPFVFLWAMMRLFYEDTFCWMTNDNSKIFWVTRAPITVSIILNFIFFINITRVLFLKMFASHTNPGRHYKYRTWFKSTLILMPLFGVHYMFFLVFNSFIFNSYDIFEIVWLYTDLGFTTCQGFLVALLYCFLNGEVQTELNKFWISFKQNYLQDNSRLIQSSSDSCYQNRRGLCRSVRHNYDNSTIQDSQRRLHNHHHRHNNNNNNSTVHSSGRTRNSFLSTIDCNPFFRKEDKNFGTAEETILSPTGTTATTESTRPLPTVTIRTATPPIGTNFGSTATLTMTTIVQQHSNKVETIGKGSSQNQKQNDEKCPSVGSSPKFSFKLWCGHSSSSSKRKIDDINVGDKGATSVSDKLQLTSIMVIDNGSSSIDNQNQLEEGEEKRNGVKPQQLSERHLAEDIENADVIDLNLNTNATTTITTTDTNSVTATTAAAPASVSNNKPCHYQSYHSIVEVYSETRGAQEELDNQDLQSNNDADRKIIQSLEYRSVPIDPPLNSITTTKNRDSPKSSIIKKNKLSLKESLSMMVSGHRQSSPKSLLESKQTASSFPSLFHSFDSGAIVTPITTTTVRFNNNHHHPKTIPINDNGKCQTTTTICADAVNNNSSANLNKLNVNEATILDCDTTINGNDDKKNDSDNEKDEDMDREEKPMEQTNETTI